MFRISFMVEDKDLAPTLHGLPKGRLREFVVQPVDNVVVTPKGELAEEHPGNTTTDRIFRALVAANITGQFDGTTGRAICFNIGLQEHSWTYHAAKLVELGLLRKTGKGSGSRYAIVPYDPDKHARVQS